MRATVQLLTMAIALCGCVFSEAPKADKLAARALNANPAGTTSVIYPAPNLDSDDYSPGKEWTPVWSDEFDGATLNPEHWNRQVLGAGHFNEEFQEYTASDENAYLEDHCLVIKAIHNGVEHGPGQYTSARLNTAQKHTWTYGKIAARIQLPHGQGMWPAFWMLGANCIENGGDTRWPFCGEIDILELYGSRNDAVVEANLHFADRGGAHKMMGAVAHEIEKGRFADQFHVFEIEWDEACITWRVDGNEYARGDLSGESMEEFQREFFILLNLAVGGTWSGSPDASTPFPQYMYVDWVRVYQQ